MARRPLIIGLTGPNAAGKGEVAAVLMKAGLGYHSLSDAVRQEAAFRGLDPTRENLIRIGNDLRRVHGPGVLARRIGRRLKGWDVVDSIRNPGEVEALRRCRGFVLLGVDATPRLRFARSVRRARAGDAMTFREFQAKELKENSRRGSAQQLTRTLAMADEILCNDGTLRRLRARARSLLKRLIAGVGGGPGGKGAAAERRPRTPPGGRARQRPRRRSRPARAARRTTARAG